VGGPRSRRAGRHAARLAYRLGELRAGAVTAVHFVVPDGIEDPARPEATPLTSMSPGGSRSPRPKARCSWPSTNPSKL